MADALNQITTHLDPEAMQAILDGATLGTSQRAEEEDPAMIEGMTKKKKKKYELLLAESWWKCMSPIGPQPKRKTLN